MIFFGILLGSAQAGDGLAAVDGKLLAIDFLGLNEAGGRKATVAFLTAKYKQGANPSWVCPLSPV